MEVTKPYEFIGFGAMDVTKPYKCIGFGAMEITKPYEFIGFEGELRSLWGSEGPQHLRPRWQGSHSQRRHPALSSFALGGQNGSLPWQPLEAEECW